MANIELDKVQIQKEKTLLDIENKIEQLKLEIKNADSHVNSTKKVLSFLSQNFEASNLKYEEGFINYSQFLEVKNKLIKTEMELLQAQFQLAFKVKIFELY